MTVYVDDWFQPARVGSINAVWCHMFTGPWDDIEELHELATRIGMRRSWFQDKPWPHQHYDVTKTVRQRAVRAGAVVIPWREAGDMWFEARRRGRGNQPPGDGPLPGQPLTLF